MRVKNWEQFQHYKDRNPVWIKLYRNLLDDPNYHGLSDRSAKYLTLIWLIASESDGCLPDVDKLAFRLRITVEQTKKVLYELSHYLEQDDSTVIASWYLEKEKEKEKDKEKEIEVLPFNDSRFIELWNELKRQPKWRNKPRTALKMSLRKLEEWGLEDSILAIENAIAGNWMGLFQPKERGVRNGVNQQKAGSGSRAVFTVEDYKSGRVPGYNPDGTKIS